MEVTDPAPEWLNYHHLRYFHAVARTGSVRAASQKLRVSQSSICTQVKHLEAALGETLYRRSGRTVALTDFGRVIDGYAEEIFALGRELLSTVRQGPGTRRLRLQLGIVDSFPKLLSLDVLRPLFVDPPSVQLTVREGKLEDLLGQLAAHRLDGVLADEPPASTVRVKTFTHPAGESGVSFCAAPLLARRLKGRFPRSLHGAPVLLPTQNTALRRELDRWFRSVSVEPVVVGEFEDAALAKIVATEGIGITVVPSLVVAEAAERYGFVSLGRTEACRVQLFLITPERRIEHPALTVLVRELGRLHSGPRRQVEGEPARRPPRAQRRSRATPR